MKRFLFIFIILFVIVYFQYLTINKQAEDFTILQYRNPSKDIVEKILFEKRIAIITDIPFDQIVYNNNPVMMITPKLYSSLNSVQHTAILKSLKKFFEYYYLPMSVKSDISINYEKHGTQTKLIKQANYRFCIAQFLGVRKVYLFPPSADTNLYFDKESGGYGVDFWNQSVTTHPKLKDAKYIEVLLHPGMALFIPYKWIYCYQIAENSMSVSFFSESIFTNILKK